MIQKRAQLVQVLNLSVFPLPWGSPLFSVARALAAAWLLLIASPTGVAASTHTLHPSTTLVQQTAGCVELIENGGFEIAGSGWTPVAGSSLFSYATSTSASGRQSLLLGFADSFSIAATFAVEQSVTLPAESTRIELSFYYNARLEGSASPGDQAGFAIYESVTNEPVTTVALAPSTNGTWSMERHDLTALAGREIRLVFATQNDDEPGQLAMFVDDVSLLACDSSSTLPPLAEPTAPSLASPQMMPLFPQAETPQATSLQTGTIDSLDACSCASSLYACHDFSNWAIAQACYNHCQVTTGFDIHGLDEDNNGIACELELVEVETESITETVTTTAIMTTAHILTRTEVVTSAAPATGAIAVAITPAVPAEGAVAPASTLSSPESASASSSPAVTLAQLLFSPLGLFMLAILLIVGLLSLAIAYLAGQRRASSTQ